jgi:transposase
MIPKLSLNSVVVMDNAPYHGRQEVKPPSKKASQKYMIDSLTRHGVAYDVSTRKANLFAAIEKLKPKDKIFKVDNMLHAQGHTALRTPQYMCNLNPIELAWANIKHYARSHNTTGDVTEKTGGTCEGRTQQSNRQQLVWLQPTCRFLKK